jgi:hypothetical protein
MLPEWTIHPHPCHVPDCWKCQIERDVEHLREPKTPPRCPCRVCQATRRLRAAVAACASGQGRAEQMIRDAYDER